MGLSLIEDSFGWSSAATTRVSVDPGARVLVINDAADWELLCARFPVEVSATYREVWFRSTGRKGRWVVPDWLRVAEAVDGVHLTLAGYLRLAGRSIVIDVCGRMGVDDETVPTAGDTDEETASLIAGWNPDTTYWLTDVISESAEAVDWRTDADSSGLPFVSAEQWVRGDRG